MKEDSKPTSETDKNDDQDLVRSFSLSTFTIIKIVFISLLGIVFTAALLYGLYKSSFVLFLILLSIYLAYLLDPLVNLIRTPFRNTHLDRFVPRSLAIVLVYLVFFGVLWIVFAVFSPSISKQGKSLLETLPRYTQSIQQTTQNITRRYNQLALSKEFEEWLQMRFAVFTEVATQIAAYFALYLTYLPWFILVPIFAFYFLKDASMLKTTFLANVPHDRWRGKMELYLLEINRTLAAYTRAQLISCFLIGSICTVGFFLIGLEYYALLGFMAGLFEFVPMLGPLTIGIIAVGVGAVSKNPWQGLYAFIFLAILRIVYDYIIYPRIVHDVIHLHPLAIIISVIIGEQIGGIPGVFLAIPVVAILTVTYKYFIKDNAEEMISEIVDDDNGSKSTNSA